VHAKVELDFTSKETIGKKLALLRRRAGLSQKEMATRLRTSQASISRLETSPDQKLKLGDLISYMSALHARGLLLVGGSGGSAEIVDLCCEILRRTMEKLAFSRLEDAELRAMLTEKERQRVERFLTFLSQAARKHVAPSGHLLFLP
jgi:transcriptional regulator with XRE-family HTH domain